jgi:hypothetical protein
MELSTHSPMVGDCSLRNFATRREKKNGPDGLPLYLCVRRNWARPCWLLAAQLCDPARKKNSPDGLPLYLCVRRNWAQPCWLLAAQLSDLARKKNSVALMASCCTSVYDGIGRSPVGCSCATFCATGFYERAYRPLVTNQSNSSYVTSVVTGKSGSVHSYRS